MVEINLNSIVFVNYIQILRMVFSLGTCVLLVFQFYVGIISVALRMIVDVFVSQDGIFCET